MNLETWQPMISVITPVYNCEKYLEESILSVINQTSKEWELILVDDGSSDSSGEICDKYSANCNVRVVHQQNMGELRSRMNGISLAMGEYILGLDADDFLDKECIETLIETIRKSKADLIWFGLRLFGDIEGEDRCSLSPDKYYTKQEIFTEVITNTNHSLCNKAIKRQLFDQNAYEALNCKVRFNLDYAQIIPVLCNVNNGYVIKEALYNYRIHQESISHRSKASQILDTGYVTEFVLQKMETSNLVDYDWKSQIWNSYLSMIGNRLVEMLVYQSITPEECEMIHESRAYIKSKKYETLKNMCFSRFISLKMFRYRLYGMWKILAAYERMKLGTTTKDCW